MHAQAAVKLDQWHHVPELHLLLAQIYQAAGQRAQEKRINCKEFLKVAANSKDAPSARSMLAHAGNRAREGQPGKIRRLTTGRRPRR